MWRCGLKVNSTGLLVPTCLQSDVVLHTFEDCWKTCTLESALKMYLEPILFSHYSKDAKRDAKKVDILKQLGLLFPTNLLEKLPSISKHTRIPQHKVLTWENIFWSDLLSIIPHRPLAETQITSLRDYQTYLIYLSVQRTAMDMKKVFFDFSQSQL
jgi:hypothetical protein